MPTIKIIVCAPAQAAIMRERLVDDGFNVNLSGPLRGTVFWDATEAKPSDPEMIFQDHAVLIGTK